MIPPEARAARDLLRATFGEALLGAWLHGSAARGALGRWSDLDVLGIVDRPVTAPEEGRLREGCLALSGRHPREADGPRPLEVMVLQRGPVAPWRPPARAAFVFGEWLRAEMEAGPVPPRLDPDLVALLAQARAAALPLAGPPLRELLPEIPQADVLDGIRASVGPLIAGLPGDERNALLTLARMWLTVETGAFGSKALAADWASARLPPALAAALRHARDAHLGRVAEDWRGREVMEAARAMADRIL